MAAALREVPPGAAGDHVFHHVGDVALHAEAALASPDAEAAPAAAEFVAASSRFALVFFGDTLGTRPAAACAPRRTRWPRRPLLTPPAACFLPLRCAGVCGLTLDQLLSHAAEKQTTGSRCVPRGLSRADARRSAPPRQPRLMQ